MTDLLRSVDATFASPVARNWSFHKSFFVNAWSLFENREKGRKWKGE